MEHIKSGSLPIEQARVRWPHFGPGVRPGNEGRGRSENCAPWGLG